MAHSRPPRHRTYPRAPARPAERPAPRRLWQRAVPAHRSFPRVSAAR